MLMLPGFFHVEPTAMGLLLTSGCSLLLFTVEDNGWRGTADGANTVPIKVQMF